MNKEQRTNLVWWLAVAALIAVLAAGTYIYLSGIPTPGAIPLSNLKTAQTSCPPFCAATPSPSPQITPQIPK